MSKQRALRFLGLLSSDESEVEGVTNRNLNEGLVHLQKLEICDIPNEKLMTLTQTNDEFKSSYSVPQRNPIHLR